MLHHIKDMAGVPQTVSSIEENADARKSASYKRAKKKQENEQLFLSHHEATSREQKAYGILHKTLRRGKKIESYISNPRRFRHSSERQNQDIATLRAIRRASKRTVQRCKIHRRRLEQLSTQHKQDPSVLRFLAPYPLDGFDGREQYIPRIVNVVSVARTCAVPGTSTRLPLSNSEFRTIATRCTGAYYAPKRFSNIQLGYSFSHPNSTGDVVQSSHSQPRARVLIFQTGQIVTTGSNGITSTRLVVNLALEQLAREANVHLAVVEFEVKNIVGSCSLGATFNCQGFADKHSENTSYDRWTFAGMTWRPASFQPGSVEIYSTGRANLPGLLSHKDLLVGFGQLVPELIDFSSSATADHTTGAAECNQDENDTGAINSITEVAEVGEDLDDELWHGWTES